MPESFLARTGGAGKEGKARGARYSVGESTQGNGTTLATATAIRSIVVGPELCTATNRHGEVVVVFSSVGCRCLIGGWRLSAVSFSWWGWTWR